MGGQSTATRESKNSYHIHGHQVIVPPPMGLSFTCFPLWDSAAASGRHATHHASVVEGLVRGVGTVG